MDDRARAIWEDYAASLDATQHHHDELQELFAWHMSVSDDERSGLAWEYVRMARDLVGREFVDFLNSKTGTLPNATLDPQSGCWSFASGPPVSGPESSS